MKTDTRVLFPCHQTWAVYKESKEIMAYGYHRGINECYASTSSESSQIKEEHELEEHAAFQLHKAVVRHSFRKIRLHRTLNEEQVVVLKGDYISLNGSKFVVCDPTYIGAPVGLAMPNMDNESANVIILE